MIIIEGIAYITWALIGFVFWIPLLVRIIAGFCASIVYNMVVNNPRNIEKSKEGLDLAVSFYTRGFTNIKAALSRKSEIRSESIQSTNRDTNFSLQSFIAQIIWTIFFWACLISPFIGGGIYNLIRPSEY